MAIMGGMGYRKRTGFMTGLTVAQISEFSLIFIAMGLELGHVNAESLGLVTLVGLITIALSVYMMTYSHKLSRLLEPALDIFERQRPYREEEDNRQLLASKAYDVILFGLGRYGAAIADRLIQRGHTVLGVDFNPDEVRHWRSHGHDAMYGDACDPEFISALPLSGVQWVVAAMPQHDLGLMHEDPRFVLMSGLKEQKYSGKVAVAAHHPQDVSTLKSKGASLVFLPFHDAAVQAVDRMTGENP